MSNEDLHEHTHCKKCGRVILRPEFNFVACYSKTSAELQLAVVAYKQKTCPECLIEKIRKENAPKRHPMAP